VPEKRRILRDVATIVAVLIGVLVAGLGARFALGRHQTKPLAPWLKDSGWTEENVKVGRPEPPDRKPTGQVRPGNQPPAGFKLVDAQDRHFRYPTTFEVPSVEELLALKVGTSAKIAIEDPDGHTERFWVTVVGKSDRGFVGSVGNNLLYVPLAFGELVAFEKQHVFRIDPHGGADDEVKGGSKAVSPPLKKLP
jgi:hypothetical protein